MLALLKKDLFVLKRSCAIYVAVLLFYIVLGVFNDNFSMFQYFLMLLTMMLPVTSMSYDERSGWNAYGMSLPVSRRTVVLSKYVFAAALILVDIGMSAVVTAADIVQNGGVLAIGAFAQPVLFACSGLVLVDVMLPVMFRFGTEKGRYVMICLFCGVAFIPMALVRLLDQEAIDMAYTLLVKVGFTGGLVAIAGVTALSMWFAAVIFERRELC